MARGSIWGRLLPAVAMALPLACGPAQAASVVLLRSTTMVDARVVPAGRKGDANRQPRYFLANLDRLEAPRRLHPVVVPGPAGGEGWLQFELPAGSHHLLVLPPGVEQNPPAVAYSVGQGRYGRLTDYALKRGRGGFWSADLGAFAFARETPADFQPLQGFWLDVPRDDAVVYAGSLSVACKGGRGLFGSLIEACDDIGVADETPSAEAVAAQAFAGRSFVASPLLPYGTLRTPPGQGADEAASAEGPAPAVVIAPASLSLASAATLHGVGPAVTLYNLLVVGEAMRRDAADERRTRERQAVMQECLDRLSSAASALGVEQRFATALPVGADADGRRWVVGMPLLRLRETAQAGWLALELGLSLRALPPAGAAAGSPAGGHVILVSGPAMPVGDPHAAASPLYLQWVPEPAQARPLADWCGEQAGAVLEAEVQAAVVRVAAYAATLRSASPVP